MSQQEKLRIRFLQKPPVKDFRWDELKTLLKGFGFVFHDPKGGSHNYFVLEKDGETYRIDAVRPHPSPVIKAYMMKNIAQKLDDWGLI